MQRIAHLPRDQGSKEPVMHAENTPTLHENSPRQDTWNDVNAAAILGPETIEDDDAPIRPSQAVAKSEVFDIASKTTRNENTISVQEDRAAYEASCGNARNLLASRVNQEHSHQPSQQHRRDAQPPAESQVSCTIQVDDESLSLSSDQEGAGAGPTPERMLRHPVDEQSVPPYPIRDETSVEGPQEPIYVAYVVEDDPTQDSRSHENEAPSSCWKTYHKYILVGLVALVFGAMIATIASLVGRETTGNDNTDDSKSNTNVLYYADKKRQLCDSNPLAQASTSVRQRPRSFSTIEECCRAEFWLQADECMMRSLPIYINIPADETTSTTDPTTPQATTTTMIPSAAEHLRISTPASMTSSTTRTTNIPVSTPSKLNLWWQQGEAIVGAAAGDEAGTSVSLSADGNMLIVGSPGALADNRRGFVQIYHNSLSESYGPNWKRLGTGVSGDKDGDNFGWSISQWSTTSIVAVGAPGHWEKNDRPGYVRITAGFGSNQHDIYGQAAGDQFGISVSLSSDGKTLAIGANANDDNGESAGQVKVFHNYDNDYVGNGTSWKQLGQDINGSTSGDNFGENLAISGDGKILAIGAEWNDDNGSNSGHVRVFELRDTGNNSSWEQVGKDIAGQTSDDQLGRSIAISSDGNILAIGAPGAHGNNDRAGYVRVYQRSEDELGSNYQQIGQDLVGKANGDQFGASVALSLDGAFLAVGANGNDDNGADSGHVRLYSIDSAGLSWTWLDQDISGENAGDNAGWSVSLSSDGKTVAIGSPWNDDNGDKSGHVRVFRRD